MLSSTLSPCIDRNGGPSSAGMDGGPSGTGTDGDGSDSSPASRWGPLVW